MAKYYLTWHNASHGIGFLKNVLAAFLKNENALPKNCENENVLLGDVSQTEMEKYFIDNPNAKPVFDKVVYFYTDQKVINETTSFAFSQSVTFMEDAELSLSLREAWQKIRIWYNEEKYKDNGFQDNRGLLAEVRIQIENNSPEILAEFNQKIWRFIHYFPVEDQIEWFKNESNLPQKIKKTLVFVNTTNFGVRSLRNNYSNLSKALLEWIRTNIKAEDMAYINISFGSYIVQVAFFVMSETGLLPENTFFLNVYDSKNDKKNLRFKDFTIAQVPSRLFSNIQRKAGEVFKNAKSPARKLANSLLTHYLNKIDSAFSILILGERGVGKSRLVKDIARQKKKGENAINVVYANCASFDDDNKAESELFGYVKGAFTGANKDKKGLFCEADEGILFLDEVHHLSKLVQAKLMTALQTDNEGKFKIRSLGSPRHTDIKCLVIFASNKTIEELRNPETGLLPDFYDRISQFIIEIPPLRETQADREDDWKNSWKHLFKHEFTHNDQKLIDWLKSELLPGNFRDLEKIALAYKAFLDFNEDIKKELSEKTAHEYARAQYKKYHGAHTPSQLPHFPIDLSKPPKVLQSEFEKMLTELIIEKYGSAEKAEKELKTLFNESDVPTAKTLRNWLGKAHDS